MTSDRSAPATPSPSRRLAKPERRVQLLETARRIVREEGTDQLTLGHLAARAGVSKPIAYDHFATRSELLIALYTWIDTEQVEALRHALTSGRQSRAETAAVLAATYLRCATDTNGEWHAVGAALAGSVEREAAFQELLDNCVRLFLSVLQPHSRLPPPELERRCIGLVGAGEALAASVLRGICSEAHAAAAFTQLILHGSRP